MELSVAHTLALRLMAEHGLAGWTFGFDRAVRRFGCCHYDDKRITLSAKLVELNHESQVRQTILHEIAHALEPGQGHNRKWQARARSIGHSGNRCYSSMMVKTPPAKYRGTCPYCGRWWERNRRPKAACGVCSPVVYDPKYRLKWRKLT
jgi:predicted SprT family Zn-dependent metalloprotease